MTSKYFPIQTETACKLKWSWSSIYLNVGQTGSCHRASWSAIPDNFSDFHNTPAKIQARNTMLAGKWPAGGCEYCTRIEQAGGTSDRQFQNAIPGGYSPDLELQSNPVNIDPFTVEVFFSNTCNMKCVYCNSRFSSSIQAEDMKFGGPVLEENRFEYQDNQYHDMVGKFWSWFRENTDRPRRLQIAGGEPFLLPDMAVLLNTLEQSERPDLELAFITNLNIPKALLQKNIDRLASLIDRGHIKLLDIYASVDCWGSQQEYIRYGFDSQLFESNLLYLLKSGVARVGLLSTVSSLSIPAMPRLVEKYLEWSHIQPLEWYMNKALQSWQGQLTVFNPVIFEYEVWSQSLAEVEEALPDQTWHQQNTKKVFLGILDSLKQNCYNDLDKQQQLKYFLIENDRRRSLDWKKTFPWLETVLRNNHVV